MIVKPLNKKVWRKWIATRPACIKKLAKQLPPDRLYRLASTGHRVTIYSYDEDGTVTVSVTGEYNRVVFNRNVFGIKPEELAECDLPPADEPLGSFQEEAEIDNDDMFDFLRSMLPKQEPS